MQALRRSAACLCRAAESYLGRFLLFIVAIFAFVLMIDMHDEDDSPIWLFRGDVGDSLPAWIEAMATAGAFVAAFAAVRHSWKILELERVSRAEADEAAERAAQADGVAAWVTPTGQTRLRNSSNLPIYDVAVAWVNGEDQRGDEFGTWAPGHEGEVRFPYETGIQDDISGETTHWEEPGTYQVLVRFRDAAGRIWQRDQFGVLAPPQRMSYATSSEMNPLSVSEIVANSLADKARHTN